MSLKDFATDLQNLYNNMSESFSQYQRSTGVTCPATCGKCCDNPEVEASPMEMIPMALEIYRRGELETWLDKLMDAETPSACTVFHALTPDKELGRCSIYEYRPSLCRVFGISGWSGKDEKISLSICKKLKVLHADKIQDITQTDDAPLAKNWSLKLMQLDSRLITERMPINLAFKKALEKVALLSMYSPEECNLD